MKTYRNIVYIFLLGVILTGCSDDDATLKDIVVDRESLEIILGYRMQIIALPVPLDASDQAFEWISDDPAIITVSAFGIVEAIAEGTTNIHIQKGSIKKTIPVTIIDPIVIPPRIGSWLFNDPTDLVKAETGENLIMVGDGFASVDGPNADNKAVRVGVGSHFRARHGIRPENDETLVHKYTLMINFKIPNTGPWYAFYQTDQNNVGDADLFINSSGAIGVGSTGYASAVTPGVWHRLVICSDLPDFNYYLDGNLISSTVQGIGDRFSIGEYILLFADNDGEDAEMDIAEVAIWEEILDEQQVMKLER